MYMMPQLRWVNYVVLNPYMVSEGLTIQTHFPMISITSFDGLLQRSMICDIITTDHVLQYLISSLSLLIAFFNRIIFEIIANCVFSTWYFCYYYWSAFSSNITAPTSLLITPSGKNVFSVKSIAVNFLLNTKNYTF